MMNRLSTDKTNDLFKGVSELIDYAECMQMATGYKSNNPFNTIGLMHDLEGARREIQDIENFNNYHSKEL